MRPGSAGRGRAVRCAPVGALFWHGATDRTRDGRCRRTPPRRSTPDRPSANGSRPFIRGRGRAPRRARGAVSPRTSRSSRCPTRSPTKCGIAHTTWFFETFVLCSRAAFLCVDGATRSYSTRITSRCSRHARPARRSSRPSVAEVAEYRGRRRAGGAQLLGNGDARRSAVILPVVELGIAHEEQHQSRF